MGAVWAFWGILPTLNGIDVMVSLCVPWPGHSSCGRRHSANLGVCGGVL